MNGFLYAYLWVHHLVLDSTAPTVLPLPILHLIGICNAQLSSSPWRLAFAANDTSATGTSSVTFSLASTNTHVLPASPDCSGTSVDSLKLYVNAAASRLITSVLVGGSSVNYQVGGEVWTAENVKEVCLGQVHTSLTPFLAERAHSNLPVLKQPGATGSHHVAGKP